MCVIFAVPDGGKFPTEEEILSGELSNDDGGGVAWAAGGKVFWEKGLKGEKVVEMIRGGVLKPPALIHFRISTEGGVCAELTHPFPCTPEAELDLSGSSTTTPLLMHNGTVMRWKDEVKEAVQAGRGTIKVPEGKWSDSRALAFLVGLYGQAYLQFLTGLDPDRVVILNPDGRIQYCGKWHHQDGFYASNESYLFGRKGKGGVADAAYQGFTQGVGGGAKPTLAPTGKTQMSLVKPNQPPQTGGTKSSGTPDGTEERLTQAQVEEIEDRLSLAWTKTELQGVLRECKGKTLVSDVRVML